MGEVAEFEAQGVLQPGEDGWWKVWGARADNVRVGDIVLSKDSNDDVTASYIADTFPAKAWPMRHGFIDDLGRPFTLGALAPIVVVRRGTHNTLAS